MAKTRVLLVDDNSLFRDGVARILGADQRFEVVGQASDGEGAVSEAARLRPDLILMDLNMPRVNGTEAVKRIRASGSTVPIGILTIFETREDVEPAIAAGANGYLPKDSTPEEMCQAAAALAAGQAGIPSPPGPAAGTGRVRPSGALSVLTGRELEVLQHLVTGATNAEIARTLGISPKTLRNHISAVYHKLGIFDRAQAVIVAVREGVVTI